MSGGPSLTFGEHLQELRGRLFIGLIALVVATAVAFPFADDAIELLAAPLEVLDRPEDSQTLEIRVGPSGAMTVDGIGRWDGRTIDPSEVPQAWTVESASGETVSFVYGRALESRLYYTGITEPIILLLKVALLMGLTLAVPVLAWQIWLFVGPGLTDRERQIILPTLLMAAALFPTGALFAYWLLHQAVVVLASFAFGDLTWLPDVGKHLSFTLTLMIAFGVVFELPAAVLVLARMGLVRASWLRGQRRFFIIGSFVVAALLTPPDVFTQLAMAVPMLLLFEISIHLCRWVEPPEG